MNNSSIIKPAQIGGDTLHVGKTLDGGFVLTVNSQSIKMAPAQVHDLAVRLFRALGFEMLPADPGLPGPKLDG